MREPNADGVKQRGAGKGGRDHDPQARKAALQVVRPGERSPLDVAKRLASDKKSAQREKYNDRLMVKARNKVKKRHRRADMRPRSRQFGVVSEGEQPDMTDHDDERRHAANEIEMIETGRFRQ